MIETIDRLRYKYNAAIEAAIEAHADLCRISEAYQAFGNVPTTAAMVEMDATTDSLIDAMARAQSAGRDHPTYITVGGDMITVGNITDSETIAIGKEIEQEAAGAGNGRRYRQPKK